MKIVPSKCSQCGGEFDFPYGGLCFQCRKIFCQTHLYKVKESKNISYYCEACKGTRIGERLDDYLANVMERLKQLRIKKE